MSLLAVPIIAIFAFIISILCLVIIFILIRRHKTRFSVYESQLQSSELIVNSLQSANDNLKSVVQDLSLKQEQTLTENTLVSKQLEHRIKSIQSQLTAQQELISQLQTDQGDDKFYSRAIKLAKIGADIDEIVTECELPYAEVEMLISVYQNKA
jgi:cell shape-determining protein MreC